MTFYGNVGDPFTFQRPWLIVSVLFRSEVFVINSGSRRTTEQMCQVFCCHYFARDEPDFSMADC